VAVTPTHPAFIGERMDYIIRPLSMTQPEWKTYIETCQEALGYSPTRGLDTQGLKIDDPASFLATLDLENNPLRNLRSGVILNKTLKHVSFSFIAIIDKKAVDKLMAITDLEIFYKERDDIYLTILTATMSTWYHTIINGSTHKEVRKVLNNCLKFFKQTGFRELWASYQEQELDDDTFFLRR